MRNVKLHSSLVRILRALGALDDESAVRADAVVEAHPEVDTGDLIVETGLASRADVRTARQVQETQDHRGFFHDSVRRGAIASSAMQAAHRQVTAAARTLTSSTAR